MAIYTTFFLAAPEKVVGGFPGWKPPLPAPVRREFLNPLTKQLVVIETRKPEWPDEESGGAFPQYPPWPFRDATKITSKTVCRLSFGKISTGLRRV